MARILSIYIDPDVCTWSQACVQECPEVLDGDTPDGIPRIREGAEKYFETHVQEIKNAAAVCPVEAIILKIQEDQESGQ